MTMAQHHHDDQEDTYFLDQLCMVALSGAFGVVCLAMFFIQKQMLFTLLGPQFHPFVLGSGIALVSIAALRGAVLRLNAGAGNAPAAPEQLHEHATCDHDHAHSHSHEDHAHSHSHSHSHAPAHGHSHGGADHDHAWAPWRYVVLLVPILLYMLGLPNKTPSLTAPPEAVDLTELVKERSEQVTTLAGFGTDGWSQLAYIAKTGREAGENPDAQPVSFQLLETMSASDADRAHWKGKIIKIKGQYMPRSDVLFSLVRLRIQCCAADAVQLNVPMLSKEPITDLKAEQWIEVSGRVDFRDFGGVQKTVLLVPGRKAIKDSKPDLNPYVQF
jgi:hypothetical protein